MLQYTGFRFYTIIILLFRKNILRPNAARLYSITMKTLFSFAPVLRACLTYVCLSFCAFVFWAHAAHAAHVQNLRIGEHPDKTRLVIETSAKLSANVFTLSSPDRLIVDFKGSNLSCGDIHVSGQDSKLLKAVRHSSDEQTLRLVFDLKRRVKVRSQFSLPAEGKKPHRLVIDLADAGAVSQMQMVEKKPVEIKAPSTRNAVIVQDPPKNKNVPPYIPNRKYVVVIDAGHGGKDPGAPGSHGVHEKHVTLATAKKLRDALQETGRYIVHLTRDDDRFIRLSERVRIARRHNADLFVSIHADSVESADVRGASVYTLSEKASDAQTARLAARENKADLIAGIDLSDEGEDVATILIDLAMRDTKNQSIFMASQFVDAFKQYNIKTLKTPMHSAGFAVLKAPDIPSVLVEIGFMSNKSEAALLRTPQHQQKVAHALRDSINSYFDKQTHYAEQ